MTTGDWIRSNIDYGRSLLSSGLEGAETTLEGAPLASVLKRSVRDSWKAMAVGAYIGAVGAGLGTRRKPDYGVVLVAALLGAAIGLTTGMAWGTRQLTGEVARGALRNIGAVRDARWLEKNPIDYA